MIISLSCTAFESIVGLIPESFLHWLYSPKNVPNYSTEISFYVGQFSQSENLSETKPPFVKMQTKQNVGRILFFNRVFGVKRSSKSNVSKTDKKEVLSLIFVVSWSFK